MGSIEICGLSHRYTDTKGVLISSVEQPDALAGEIHVPGLPVKMSATPGRIGPVPSPGQHTDEILTSLLNYDAAHLVSLRSAKVIA